MYKKNTLRTIVFLIFAGFFCSCTNNDREDDELTTSNSEVCFYYYFEEKVFVNKVLDKMVITFSTDTDGNQRRELVKNYSSLRLIEGWCNFDVHNNSFASLQSKNRKQIPSETIEFFINDSRITSATYVYETKGSWIGLTDIVIVKLKETTTYEQFENLIEQNDCKIVAIYEFPENRILFSVPKTSKFNSMQMSCLFYETGLFEYTTPNKIMLNAY